jgi:hypothetical protein
MLHEPSFNHFPAVGTLVVCSGIYLHLTRLFLEPAELVAKIYTPNFDLAFYMPMLFTAVCMLIFWRSVPIHLCAQIRQSNDFVLAFRGGTAW